MLKYYCILGKGSGLMNNTLEYLKNNGGYDYKLYNQLCPGMGEPDSNIVEYAEDFYTLLIY